MKLVKLSLFGLLVLLLATARATDSAPAITGSYQATLNASTLGSARPSLGHKLSLAYAPFLGGSIDSRTEYYIDGSYNGDPPGVLQHNLNEPMFEQQVMFSHPLRLDTFGVTAGLLFHHNLKFPDQYYWAMVGLTHTLPLREDLTLSSSVLAEKKTSGARWFYDLAGTLEWRFTHSWNTQLSYHRYENVGETDPKPTQKEEFEVGFNRALTSRQTVGVSFFRHVQFGAPNDQFSFVKLKYTVSF